jgi:Cytochrome c554 and c-prime
MKILSAIILMLISGLLQAANFVPTEVQMPGTQPREIGEFDKAEQCDFCHGGYNKTVEPQHNWQGSMMSHAARDPVFWATLAVAEQDFDGSGDVCIRCHTAGAWTAGRSVPTDGTAMLDRDKNGIECDTCHRMTNPNQTELQGVMKPPFVAKTGSEGHYGSAQYSMWPKVSKLGPYSDSVTKHPSQKSNYHRNADFCGTCHDVSNPVTGDLAHNNGAQVPLPAGSFSGIYGSSVETKAAFKNPPYKYGVVERTYSEYKASLWPTFKVSDYAKLPATLKTGTVKKAYDAAILAGTGGNYEDGETRFFTCQTCHMRPVVGQASSTIHNDPKTRKDMPTHDLTGGNYWMPQAIQWLDSQNKLRMGGGLKPWQISAMNDGIQRAKDSLSSAATLTVIKNQLNVANLTGHKLISGYPEGRRMWLNTKWYNSSGTLLREDGAYGNKTVTIDGLNQTVRTLLDLTGKNTRIYEVHGAMTQEWANQLLKLGSSRNLPLSFDTVTGAVKYTLGKLADGKTGTYQKTFHFILNNKVVSDNRIPPYGFDYNEAKKRNALPVPEAQYDSPRAGGKYNYIDRFTLTPPTGAVTAQISLMYQPTSWEYIQFLYLANNRSNPSLQDEGKNMLDAWLNTGMAEPYAMATASWKK